MKRREFLAFLTGLTTWPLGAHSEQAAIPTVGFLSSLSAAALTGPIAAFRNGLQSAGYTEGKNVEIEFRWADGHYDRLPALAADLVSRLVTVIVTVGGARQHLRPKLRQQRSPSCSWLVGIQSNWAW